MYLISRGGNETGRVGLEGSSYLTRPNRSIPNLNRVNDWPTRAREKPAHLGESCSKTGSIDLAMAWIGLGQNTQPKFKTRWESAQLIATFVWHLWWRSCTNSGFNYSVRSSTLRKAEQMFCPRFGVLDGCLGHQGTTHGTKWMGIRRSLKE